MAPDKREISLSIMIPLLANVVANLPLISMRVSANETPVNGYKPKAVSIFFVNMMICPYLSMVLGFYKEGKAKR